MKTHEQIIAEFRILIGKYITIRGFLDPHIVESFILDILKERDKEVRTETNSHWLLSIMHLSTDERNSVIATHDELLTKLQAKL